MKKQTEQAEAPRKGIAVRIDITDDELWSLRNYATDHKSSVPKLLASEIRKLLKAEISDRNPMRARKPDHEQIEVILNGEKYEVDRNVAPLVISKLT